MARTPEQEFQYRQQLWGTDDGMTQFWIDHLSRDTTYQTSICMPFVWAGEAGVLMTVSSPESTTLQKANDLALAQSAEVVAPYWLKFKVWWFPRMAFLNFTGKFSVAVEINCAEDVV